MPQANASMTSWAMPQASASDAEDDEARANVDARAPLAMLHKQIYIFGAEMSACSALFGLGFVSLASCVRWRRSRRHAHVCFAFFWLRLAVDLARPWYRRSASSGSACTFDCQSVAAGAATRRLERELAPLVQRAYYRAALVCARMLYKLKKKKSCVRGFAVARQEGQGDAVDLAEDPR